MASAFTDSLMASGGNGNTLLKFWGNTTVMTIRILPEVGIYKSKRNLENLVLSSIILLLNVYCHE